MISRLQLNLRYTPSPETHVSKLDPMFTPPRTDQSSRGSVIFTTIFDTDHTDSQPSSREEKSFFTVGNLGAELVGPFENGNFSSQGTVQGENVELSENLPSRGRDW